MTTPEPKLKTGRSVKDIFGKLFFNQLLIPLVALLFLVILNLCADPSFFKITLEKSSTGFYILSGNLISIIDNGSELAILAIGMTLVTAASGGQDISVGSAIAIAGSIVLRVIKGLSPSISGGELALYLIFAFVLCVIVSALFGAFNGVLVAYFKKPTIEHYKRFYLWRIFISLQWADVAIAKHYQNEGKHTKHNFLEVAKYFVNNGLLAKEKFEALK